MTTERQNDNLYLTLIAFCLLSFFGAVIYRIYTLNTFSIITTLVVAIGGTILLKRNFNLKFAFPRIKQFTVNDWLFVFVYLCFFLGGTLFLLSRASDQAITSPWQVAGWQFFCFYLPATAIVVLTALKKNKAFNVLIILHFWLSFSIALLIYKIGYGFDPFIHQASVKYIDEYGMIYPKTFYYLGQYSIITILHKITLIPIVFLDKLLVPLSASLLLPLAGNYIFSLKFKHEVARKLLLLFILILPFSMFIVTTPQNLAYLLLLLIILIGLIARKKIDWIVLYLLALTCFVLQPIAGIPAISFAIFLTIHKYHSNYKHLFYVLIFAFNIIALPASFIWVEKAQNPEVIVNHLFDFNSVALSNLEYPRQENWALNFIYLLQENFQYLILIIILVGLYFVYTKKKYLTYPSAIYFNQALALFISYLLTRNLAFGYLIDYERQNYADRVLFMSILFALPFILIALYHLILRILKQEKIIQYSFLSILVLTVSASLYLSYPRFDKYFDSRGFATSAQDVEAVQWIDADAKQQDYLVLANQQVSAASLREFGFAKYYAWKEKDQIKQVFYYPIPTGGPMYQYYLEMADQQATKETIYKAMDLAGVHIGYFVLNSYWWTFDQRIKEGKLTANSYEIIGNNNIYIFKYTR